MHHHNDDIHLDSNSVQANSTKQNAFSYEHNVEIPCSKHKALTKCRRQLSNNNLTLGESSTVCLVFAGMNIR